MTLISKVPSSHLVPSRSIAIIITNLLLTFRVTHLAERSRNLAGLMPFYRDFGEASADNLRLAKTAEASARKSSEIQKKHGERRSGKPKRKLNESNSGFAMSGSF